MHYSEHLKTVMIRLAAGRSLREVAEQAGCDHTLIHSMTRHGRIPRRETLRRIADGLRLPEGERAELFAAAGYIEFPQATAPAGVA